MNLLVWSRAAFTTPDTKGAAEWFEMRLRVNVAGDLAETLQLMEHGARFA